MTVDKFAKKLRDLIGELEESDLTTPVGSVVSTLQQEIYRLENSRARFMYEMKGTY